MSEAPTIYVEIADRWLGRVTTPAIFRGERFAVNRAHEGPGKKPSRWALTHIGSGLGVACSKNRHLLVRAAKILEQSKLAWSFEWARQRKLPKLQGARYKAEIEAALSEAHRKRG